MDVIVEFRDFSIDHDRPIGSPNSFACQYEWSAHIPRLHRVLADPSGALEFPKVPQANDPLQWHTAYWEACYYFMVVLLGWRNPGRGLEWYLKEGRLVGDSHIGVLRTLFDGDCQLGRIAAWLWSGGWNWNHSDLRDMTSYRRSAETPDTWWDGTKVRSGHDAPLPAGGGTNSLHLSHSLDVDRAPSDPGTTLVSSPATRSASLLLDSMAGWYHELQLHGTTLPDLGAHSWHVDVVVKPVGWLGTFRRSRVTGLWFLGRHSVHMAGQPEADESS